MLACILKRGSLRLALVITVPSAVVEVWVQLLPISIVVSVPSGVVLVRVLVRVPSTWDRPTLIAMGQISSLRTYPVFRKIFRPRMVPQQSLCSYKRGQCSELT